jgi:phage gpG-like protein
MADDKKLREIERKYKNLKRRLPRVIGQIAVNFSKDNFRRQGFLDGGRVQKWKKRKNNKGKEGRNILTGKSSRLKRSVQVIRTSSKEIVIGTPDVVYGQIHNEGGLLKKSKAALETKHKASGNKLYKRIAEAAAVETRMPERRFMGNSTDLQKLMIEKINLELSKIFK